MLRSLSTLRSRSLPLSLLKPSSHLPRPSLLLRLSSTYISSHNTTLTPTHILSYLSKNHLPHTSRSPNQISLKECPFCPKPTNNNPSNQHKLYIKTNEGGAYYCFRCGAKGSWYDFVKRYRGFSTGDEEVFFETKQPEKTVNPDYKIQPNVNPQIQPLPLPPSTSQNLYSTSLETSPSVLKYLTEVRGINLPVLRKYGVGMTLHKFNNGNGWEEEECVTFPWMLRGEEIRGQESLRGCTVEGGGEGFKNVRFKVRSVDNKGNQRLLPTGGSWGLFGWHTIKPSDTQIVITEGEYDAMAVYQSTGLPSISLPNGARSLPPCLLPLLERFERVFLWMDDDSAGREGAEGFIKKLGVKRCFIVKSDYKDANDSLRNGEDMIKVINSATVKRHEDIQTFQTLRRDVISELIEPAKYSGVRPESLPGLGNIIKGFRRGELTVLTGPTGCGKTTLLSQISLDFVEKNVTTMWGSFEVKNTKLMQKMLHQFGRKPLPLLEEKEVQRRELNLLADDFEVLPLYFLKFHGSTGINAILDAMAYAVYVHDVQHFILDNLQFMLDSSPSVNQFQVQDSAISEFRKFATENNVHVTLVCHPRKEIEGEALSMASFFGSAKATQEADNVLILQHDGRRKRVEVKKNRWDGELGTVPLFFDVKSGRYKENEVGDVEQRPANSNSFGAFNVKKDVAKAAMRGGGLGAVEEVIEEEEGEEEEEEITTTTFTIEEEVSEVVKDADFEIKERPKSPAAMPVANAAITKREVEKAATLTRPKIQIANELPPNPPSSLATSKNPTTGPMSPYQRAMLENAKQSQTDGWTTTLKVRPQTRSYASANPEKHKDLPRGSYAPVELQKLERRIENDERPQASWESRRRDGAKFKERMNPFRNAVENVRRRKFETEIDSRENVDN